MLADFMHEYALRYRSAFESATKPPPDGPGYPTLPISPFVGDGRFEIYIAKDGVVVNELRDEPSSQWYIAGGPALKVDYEPTRTPPPVTRFLREQGLSGRPIGIFRIISKEELPRSVWEGSVEGITRTEDFGFADTNLQLLIHETECTLDEVVAHMSFGAFGYVLELTLPQPQSQVGETVLLKGIGVFPADLNNRRYFWHLEIHGHADEEAWDKRFINLRVQNDLRRDLARTLSDPTGEQGGSLSLGAPDAWLQQFTDRLDYLREALEALRSALDYRGDDVESVFHAILEKYPILIDVYGSCESKPRFSYPDSEKSPVGKQYLEPDFLVIYPNRSYRLIEIERPGKQLATQSGPPRAEVTQAVFQIAEWTHYIKTHYQQLATRYPEIHTNHTTCVIMSRTTQRQFTNRADLHRYLGLLKEQFKLDELLTFDDLWERANFAYVQLSDLRAGRI